jgi:hypothetical protein
MQARLLLSKRWQQSRSASRRRTQPSGSHEPTAQARLPGMALAWRSAEDAASVRRHSIVFCMLRDAKRVVTPQLTIELSHAEQ